MTGVPVPGANAGSRQSTSKVTYTGRPPTRSRIAAMVASTPSNALGGTWREMIGRYNKKF